MAHYARIDEENIVTDVVVVPEEHDHRGQDYLVDDLGLSGTWIKTSYNTAAGKRSGDGEPFRKNYAAIGHVFDAGRDAFIPPKPFPSWSLNEQSCLWESPTPMPLIDEKTYDWDEAAAEWVERVIQLSNL